ncbi:hypothetical protein [Actinomadura sp. 9N407]|uniref:hypothetical protein n=1 Tax=Actinomadura sp. 9N407 TaxID=3375154 RepID=UPI0037A6650D
MDLEDSGCRARWPIRDRDGEYPGLFDTVLAGAGFETVLTGVRMPRMNAIMERWVLTCRRELLDRILILTSATWFMHCASSRPSITSIGLIRASRTPGRALPCPRPITDLKQMTRLDVRRRHRLGGILNQYENAA